MPSAPRPKGEAKAATKADREALEQAGGAPGAPEGAALVSEAPERGRWRALLDESGRPVLVDGKPVRVP